MKASYQLGHRSIPNVITTPNLTKSISALELTSIRILVTYDAESVSLTIR